MWINSHRAWLGCLLVSIVVTAGGGLVGWGAPAARSAPTALGCGCGTSAARDFAPAPPLYDTTLQADARRPIYAWKANPYVFLVKAFRSEGIEPRRSHRLAEAVLSQTNLDAVHEPRVFLRFAFSAVGFDDAAAEGASAHAINLLSRQMGDILPLLADAMGEEANVGGASSGSPRPALNTRAFYEWRGDLFQFIRMSLIATGMERSQAMRSAEHAEAMSMALDPRFAEECRERSPEEVLVRAFLTLGLDIIEAKVRALVALQKLNVRGYLAPVTAASSDGTCSAYEVRIIWCVNGQQHVSSEFIKRNSWDGLLQACPSMSQCPVGQQYWWTLRVSDANCFGTPGVGTCIWIAAVGGLEDVECSRARELNCFDETSGTIDCELIEKICGDEGFGPSGCPDCG